MKCVSLCVNKCLCLIVEFWDYERKLTLRALKTAYWFEPLSLFVCLKFAAFSTTVSNCIVAPSLISSAGYFQSENTYGATMNYTTKQSLFDENRTNIRGAAAF